MRSILSPVQSRDCGTDRVELGHCSAISYRQFHYSTSRHGSTHPADLLCDVRRATLSFSSCYVMPYHITSYHIMSHLNIEHSTRTQREQRQKHTSQQGPVRPCLWIYHSVYLC